VIEAAGRTCYKSEDKITESSAVEFVKKILKRGHLSVIEHASMTVRFVVNRGFTHELVRHRLASFSQESTRYCNYKGGVEFIIPPWVDVKPGEYNDLSASTDLWVQNMLYSEARYLRLLELGWKPQMARDVLPIGLKTEIVMTCNFREWLHVFSLRCSKAAHPQMQELMPLVRKVFLSMWPVFGEYLNV
jgi:thymidylate synthase (FAD)